VEQEPPLVEPLLEPLVQLAQPPLLEPLVALQHYEWRDKLPLCVLLQAQVMELVQRSSHNKGM
jgi:hypothetical protein